ncbi:MAG: TIGR03960 family B12-binding radical SAM protein [Thermoguttaceae bacterium]|nr:TIGR03960 family B12-binding radical SAM protein [Thermoguttaceae bacterium]
MNYAEILRHTIFPQVQTPGQYVGGELNMVVKNPARVKGRFCLSFPDTYSIGMSCHGIQVLYSAINRDPDWYCERVFAPMRDMERLLLEHDLPLCSLETTTPLRDFDVLGFSLQHELAYSNVLTILKLGQIPLHRKDRGEKDPLVVAGGPCVQNPEPMSDFIDAFIMGDGEEADLEMAKEWLALQSVEGSTRRENLRKMSQKFPWLYVPDCYVCRVENGLEIPYPESDEIPGVIRQAVLEKLDSVPLPTRPIVPNVEAVQDRIALEIMRGCPWQCRFCQSNPIRRPVRSRKPEAIMECARAAIANTGHSEISLLSLSTSDYPWFEKLSTEMRDEFSKKDVAISVPSLRVNKHLAEVGETLSTERHSGLTIAPEAARDDMRRVIGKRVTNEDLMAGCRIAFENGFQRVKLYFMIGLPGERAEDIDGMIELARQIGNLGKEVSGRFPTIVVSVSNLVPKPQTPLQWYPMADREYLTRAQRYLRCRKLPGWIQIKYHEINGSLLEGVFCRGDRTLGKAILRAWEKGARFDSWSDQFKPEIWWEALEECGIDLNLFLHTPREPETNLPWSRIEIFQGMKHLVKEFQLSREDIRALEPSVKTMEAGDWQPAGKKENRKREQP